MENPDMFSGDFDTRLLDSDTRLQEVVNLLRGLNAEFPDRFPEDFEAWIARVQEEWEFLFVGAKLSQIDTVKLSQDEAQLLHDNLEDLYI